VSRSIPDTPSLYRIPDGDIGDMLWGVIIAFYLIGVFATPYVIGLADGDDELILVTMLVWPIYLVLFAPLVIGRLLYELGQRHR
jgi:predicted Na+-dependent transporter